MRHRKTLTRTKLGPNGYGRGTGEVIVVGLVARGLRAQASIPAWGGLQFASQAELEVVLYGGKNRQALS